VHLPLRCREEYPAYRIPYIIMPFWATAALMVLAGIMR
jgi:hypothetical protein